MPSEEGPPNEAKKNRLLAALPGADFRRLLPRLERVSLSLMQAIYETDRLRTDVLFPIDSIISNTVSAAEGVVEVAMVGNEGMAGLPVVFGSESWPVTATCLLPGEAWRMTARALRDAAQELASLRRLLDRYASYLLTQSFQSTACNRLHTAAERMCRWLLMTHDRAASAKFPMKHEFLARMLGVRRPTVSLVAGQLQQAGLIRYSRGIMAVLDRSGLESASCQCYNVERSEIAHLLHHR